jgi:hypothetical protein
VEPCANIPIFSLSATIASQIGSEIISAEIGM